MKDWEELLIGLYFYVCKEYNQRLKYYVERFSNNNLKQQLSFSDEEAITIYLYGLLDGRKTVKEIHRFAKNHLDDWFPTLISYAKFNARINRMAPALHQLSESMIQNSQLPEYLKGGTKIDILIDSMPIVMAKGSRADQAKVATELANKGYCSTKNLYYHGIKLHLAAAANPGSLPIPVTVECSGAKENDNTVFKDHLAYKFRNVNVFVDKIYDDIPAKEFLASKYNIEVYACQRRRRFQKNLHSDQKFFSTLVSRKRQPVESFFNWIQEKSGIENASKVRSTLGLLKHIYGRLAAALFIFSQNF